VVSATDALKQRVEQVLFLPDYNFLGESRDPESFRQGWYSAMKKVMGWIEEEIETETDDAKFNAMRGKGDG
jgi:hypothetical protein